MKRRLPVIMGGVIQVEYKISLQSVHVGIINLPRYQ